MKTLWLLLKGIFSLLAVLIGCSLILWVLYNEFIHRMPEYQRPLWVPIFGIAPVMIGVGINWGRQVIQQLHAQPHVAADAVHEHHGQSDSALSLNVMKMDWNYIKPECAKSSIAALAFATLIHLTSPVHFLVAAAVLLLAGPVTDIIIESIASRNPDAGERIIVKSWWPPVVFFGVVIIISLGLWQWVPLPFMSAFAYALLLWSAVGAINAIVIEVEDNATGGWLNPNGRK